MNAPNTTLEYVLKSAIYENKMELIEPSRDYSEREIAYIKGYIQSLEDTLYELEILNEENLSNLYKNTLYYLLLFYRLWPITSAIYVERREVEKYG